MDVRILNMSACPSHVFLVFKSIYTVLCTEHVIYLYQTLALIITTLHEVTLGQEVSHIELSETVECSSDLMMGCELNSQDCLVKLNILLNVKNVKACPSLVCVCVRVCGWVWVWVWV